VPPPTDAICCIAWKSEPLPKAAKWNLIFGYFARNSGQGIDPKGATSPSHITKISSASFLVAMAARIACCMLFPPPACCVRAHSLAAAKTVESIQAAFRHQNVCVCQEARAIFFSFLRHIRLNGQGKFFAIVQFQKEIHGHSLNKIYRLKLPSLMNLVQGPQPTNSD